MPRTFPGRTGTVIETAEVPTAQKIVENVFKGQVHEVHLIDGSGSMSTKFKNAVAGINKDLSESLKAAIATDIAGTFSIFQFGDAFSESYHGNVTLAPITRFAEYQPIFLCSGSTYLYGSIIHTINLILSKKAPEDKVLLKILTDGQDNASPRNYREAAAKLIKDVQANNSFTVTFVGTKDDVHYVTHNLNVDISNTLIHDNTDMGIEKAYMKTALSSVQYRSKLSKGINVSLSFYGKSTD